MINEHHSTPSCSDVSISMSAAILARITKRAKIALMGNILPIQDNPVMVAEQIAMADLISGGRIISGFVRGVGVETWWSNANPVHNRERFEECHDLIVKCWTEPGPFRWEGKHYHFRHVNPWCLPLQKPHPPIWVPGTASPETALWAGRKGYTYVPFLVPLPIARELFELLPPGRGRGRPRGDAGQSRLPALRRGRRHARSRRSRLAATSSGGWVRRCAGRSSTSRRPGCAPASVSRWRYVPDRCRSLA